MKFLDPSTWIAQSWKNGRGTTLEIARWPAGAADYDVRVSLAKVEQSGPFSTFPGYRRYSFLVGPAPIVLDAIELVVAGDYLALPGGTPIEATLPAGPTQLLNVLARADVVVGRGPTAHPVRFTFELATKIARASDPPERTDRHDCVWIV